LSESPTRTLAPEIALCQPAFVTTPPNAQYLLNVTMRIKGVSGSAFRRGCGGIHPMSYFAVRQPFFGLDMHFDWKAAAFITA
jgi:hypothetical protein